MGKEGTKKQRVKANKPGEGEIPSGSPQEERRLMETDVDPGGDASGKDTGETEGTSGPSRDRSSTARENQENPSGNRDHREGSELLDNGNSLDTGGDT